MSDLTRGAEEAWDSVLGDPAAGRARAVEIEAAARRRGDVEARVVALRAIGGAARELGEHDVAARALDTAIRLARRHGLATRLAGALVTRAGLQLERGHAHRALRDLDEASAALDGRTTLELATQRAVVLDRLGRYREAVTAYEAVGDVAHGADPGVRCKYLNNMAGLLAEIGRHEEAIAALSEAADLADALGPSAQAIVTHNHAAALLAAGRVRDALTRFDEAEALFVAAGVPVVEHHLARLDSLLALRLGEEAVATGQRVVEEVERSDAAFLRGDAHLALARALLVKGDAAAAVERASSAATIYRRQRRPAWAANAEVVRAAAALARGEAHGDDVAAVQRAAAMLRRRGVTGSAAEADLLAGRLALALGRRAVAVSALRRAARDGTSGTALQRLGGSVAAALLAEAAGDPRAARRAARRGLVLLDRYRASTASLELGARVSAHGELLARIGLGTALESGRPSDVHDWLEAWRGRALLVAGSAHGDPVLTDLLARLRHLLGDRDDDPGHSARGEQEQAALESAIRTRARTVGVAGASTLPAVGLAEVRARLAGRVLVEIGTHDGDGFAVVAHARGSRLVRLGPAAAINDELGHVMTGVRRLAVQAARRRDAGPTVAAIRHALRRLDECLVAPLGLGEEAVVVVPPARLVGLPWGLLPGLAERPVTVSPSATVWARADAAARGGRSTTLVAGPRLPHAREEVEAIARATGARAIVGEASTTSAVADALGHADLVHIACHGHLRIDNPMFSSLELADGPLTAYDLDSLATVAPRVVLAACSSGASSVHAGDELIGLLSVLLARGASSLVASSALVPDVSTKDLMVALHRSLASGRATSEALLDARHALDRDDPVALAASLAFGCYGAG